MERLDRRIRIYHVDEIKAPTGEIIRVKHYLNETEEEMFKASFRELSSNEIVRNKEANIESTCQFKINRRKVQTGDFIEFNRPLFGLKTYAINSVDAFDDKGRSRLILRAIEIDPGIFDRVRYGE